MRIARKIEMTAATNSAYVIGKSSLSRKIVCPKCGALVPTAAQTAGTFDIAQRRVFQIIEAGAAHFTETETGAAMICLKSPTIFFEANGRK